MSDQAVIDELTRALEPARSAFNRLAEPNLLDASYLGAVAATQTLVQPIIAALEAHAVFARMSSRYFGDKQLALSPAFQGTNLLQVAIQRNPRDAVAWLHRVSSMEVADIRFVAVAHGLQISNRVGLRNGVELMPLEQLPPSANAAGIIEQSRTIRLPSLPPGFSPIGATLVTLQIRATSRQVATNSNSEQELERSIKAFTLVNDAVPIVGISWNEFVDPDLALAEFGRGWRPPTFEGQIRMLRQTTIDEEALTWVDQYLRLSSDVKKICDLAIDRLNMARYRRSPGDKAIEGAICLEALLGDEDHNELTYKLRLRSALLLETDINERKKIKKIVGAFYSLRSKTVHGRSKKHKDDGTIAKDGLSVCGRVLQAIVRRNEIPRPAEWELLGGPPT